MKSSNLRRGARGLYALISAALLSVGFKLAHAQISDVYSVGGVIIEGNRRIDTNAIRVQLKGTSGRVTASEVNEDVKTLYNTGFFDQVTVSVVTTPSGERKLKYTVAEKPVVRKVLIKGNDDVSESDLAEILKFDARRFVDKAKIHSQGARLLSSARLLRRRT